MAKLPLGSKENPIIIEDNNDVPTKGRFVKYHIVNSEHIPIPFQEGPKSELNISSH